MSWWRSAIKEVINVSFFIPDPFKSVGRSLVTRQLISSRNSNHHLFRFYMFDIEFFPVCFRVCACNTYVLIQSWRFWTWIVLFFLLIYRLKIWNQRVSKWRRPNYSFKKRDKKRLTFKTSINWFWNVNELKN